MIYWQQSARLATVTKFSKSSILDKVSEGSSTFIFWVTWISLQYSVGQWNEASMPTISSIHFSRTPTCDGHGHTLTDRQTQGHTIYRVSIASCSKNCKVSLGRLEDFPFTYDEVQTLVIDDIVTHISNLYFINWQRTIRPTHIAHRGFPHLHYAFYHSSNSLCCPCVARGKLRNICGHVVRLVDQSLSFRIFHSAFYLMHSAIPHFTHSLKQ